MPSAAAIKVDCEAPLSQCVNATGCLHAIEIGYFKADASIETSLAVQTNGLLCEKKTM